MKKHIGTKVIQAEPAYRYWMDDGEKVIVAHDEDRPEKVMNATACEDGYKVQYPDGYVSWSPKEVFEEAYRPIDGLNFGLAIEAAKMGKRIARRGWNGKNMSVAYQKGYPDGIPCNKNTAEAWGMQEGELFKCRPYLQMRCADGTFQMWLASQSDILADDWYIVE